MSSAHTHSPALAVVLVETAGPLNLGSIARLCANYEPQTLRLVNPRCNTSDPLAELMAVHGRSWLEQIEIFSSLAAAVADCVRVVACSGRIEAQEREHHSPQDALRWLLEPQKSAAAVALVFGREDHGLNNEELLLAGKLLRIPTGPNYPSLNLSHAVAICLAEVQLHLQLQLERQGEKQQPLEQQKTLVKSSAPIAAHGQLEQTMLDGEAMLLEAGFLYPHTARARMAKLRQMMLRLEPTAEEVALLRGMFRQLRWAIGRNSG